MFHLADHVSIWDKSNGLGMPDDWIKPQFLNQLSVNWEGNEGDTKHIFASSGSNSRIGISIPNQINFMESEVYLKIPVSF